MSLFKTFSIACGIFAASGFSAFIQAPIPPSESGNYFEDSNGDGKMDLVHFTFLGKLSRDYLDSTVKSLSFNWFDASGTIKRFSFSGSELPFDSTQANSIHIQVPTENASATETSLPRQSETALILFDDSSSMEIRMQERIAPQINSAILFSAQKNESDSLIVSFSEPVKEMFPGEHFLEFRHSEETCSLSTQNASWDFSHSTVKISRIPGEAFPQPGDSIRILPASITDTLGNKTGTDSPFRKIFSVYPFRLQTNSLATVTLSPKTEIPIFERIFTSPEFKTPEKNSLGIAMTFGGEELREYLQKFRGTKEAVFPEHLSLSFALQIYTRTGEYVTSVHSTTKCSDEKFPGGNCLANPQTIFLRWNLMANNRQIVGTGVYLVKILAEVRYQKTLLWQSGSGKSAVQTWGIKRIDNGSL